MNSNIPSKYVSELIDYALATKLSLPEDKIFLTNAVLSLIGESEYTEPTEKSEPRRINEILSDICDIAVKNGKLEQDTTTYRDLFDTAVMGVLMPRPSEVIAEFKRLYAESPEKATDYFYKVAIDSNYVRWDRIEKNLQWVYKDETYGDIDITVNLSKPEKDPRAIAAAKLLPQSGYPKCLLCCENEGYAGTVAHPARQNLRLVPINLAGDSYFLQYSPYVYYNEHCIVLNADHHPMKIDRDMFEKLLRFVEQLPHYFLGSNADLPIVGGSILSHDHMQGGHYTFAMEKAPIETPIEFAKYKDLGVTGGIVRWPMSVVRINCDKIEPLVELATEMLDAWRGYTDESATIFAETDGTPHNTITPIARRRGELFELDLVLRNNLTTEEFPLGLYHPHPEKHNIKKENIGLIEVMGLSVLPARLKEEMETLAEILCNGGDPRANDLTEKHADWVSTFKDKYTFTKENALDILHNEIGRTFSEILEDAGVYKRNADGKEAFLRFLATLDAKEI